MRRNWITCVTMVLALGAVVPAAGAATFNSGSLGENGPLPPGALPPTTNTMTLDLNTGIVTYYNAPNPNPLGSAPLLNIPPGGFQDGVLRLSTVTIAVNVTLNFVRNTRNTPVTLLAQTNVTINGTINIEGQAGRPAVSATSFDNAGGAGGPGGFAGGAGGNGVAVASGLGGVGLGPGGARPGTFPPNSTGCSGAGGSYGTQGQRGFDGGTPCAIVADVYGNPQLLPLIGGSGGAGASANQTPVRTGGSGGGGGGAILVAATGTLRLDGPGSTITVRGGAGGTNISGENNGGGAGSGGAIRLVATTLTGSGGTLNVWGGYSVHVPYGNGGLGRVRLEAYTNTLTVTIPPDPWVPNVRPTPSVTTPGSVTLASPPQLRITSVGGITAPDPPTGSYALPDITLPANAGTTVTVVVNATNVPDGRPVALRVVPLTGSAITDTTPPLSGGTAQKDVTLPNLDQPYVVNAEVTFQLGGWLDSPIKYAGEEVTTVKVTASLGGASQVKYFTASGREVPADALAGLGLPR